MYLEFLGDIIKSPNLPDLSKYETADRFEAYRLTKTLPSPSDEPFPLFVVSNLDKGGEIVTYTVQVLNYKLELIVCNIEGKAPNQKRHVLGEGSYGHVRSEFSTERNFAVKRQLDNEPPPTSLGESISKSKIEEVLTEYALTKICSFYELGPQVDTHIGFDVLCYEDCVEFHLELCKVDYGDDLWRH